MRREIFLFLIIILLAGLIDSAISGESVFFGENWFRYTQQRYDGNTLQSGFSVERIYLRWNYKHTDWLESRITTEIFSSSKSNDANGAGLKIKDAYVKFKNIIPEGDITVGLQKQYFGRVYDWEYWPIEKAMEDRYGIIKGSRDYGISVGGYIPKGFGTWRLEAINGEGYKKSGDNINFELAYLADLRVIPVAGLTIGGSFITENNGPDSASYNKRMYYTGLGRFAKGPVDIWVQYLGGEYGDSDDPTSQTGYMIFPKFNLKWLTSIDFELMGSFSFWDPDNDTEDDGEFLYLAGLNYYFSRAQKGNPDVMLQLVLDRIQPELEDAKPIDQILLQ
ncbi:hypothetical protein JW877_05455, partial [bacterium]|nr:hypothetical protein [bacterium]